MTRLIIPLLVIVIVLLILAMKSNGAVDHPLLTDAAIRESNEPVIPWRLYSHCPVDRRNVPFVEERSA